jgi:hypothetical protein
MVLPLKTIDCKRQSRYLFFSIFYLYRYLMETNIETGDSNIIKEYNLETRQWEQSATRRDEEAESSKVSNEDGRN